MFNQYSTLKISVGYSSWWAQVQDQYLNLLSYNREVLVLRWMIRCVSFSSCYCRFRLVSADRRHHRSQREGAAFELKCAFLNKFLHSACIFCQKTVTWEAFNIGHDSSHRMVADQSGHSNSESKQTFRSRAVLGPSIVIPWRKRKKEKEKKSSS